MTYKSRIETNNTELQSILETVSALPEAGGSGGIPDFTYTGQCTIKDDGDNNWRIAFITSGTLALEKSLTVDIFCCGAGGGGGLSTTNWSDANVTAGGGGGGYTATIRRVVLQPGDYAVTVGAGGAEATAGGASSFGPHITARGGNAGEGYYKDATGGVGGAGGSGGGAGAAGGSPTLRNGMNGGSNGSDGGSQSNCVGGAGQGSNTWEFGEEGTELYSGGGGGGASYQGGYGTAGSGGAGGYANTTDGGGAGATTGNGENGSASQTFGIGGGSAGTKSSSNYGGGGGGGGIGGGGGGAGREGKSGAGAQGIVIIRNAR